jgi:hypothetical protein
MRKRYRLGRSLSDTYLGAFEVALVVWRPARDGENVRHDPHMKPSSFFQPVQRNGSRHIAVTDLPAAAAHTHTRHSNTDTYFGSNILIPYRQRRSSLPVSLELS